MASNTVQFLKLPRLSVTANECSKAVPTNQGMKEAFSTGSQNHQPPQPNSSYAHHEPRAMPAVKKDQATVVQGRDHRAQAASNCPDNKAAMAKAKATEKPT